MNPIVSTVKEVLYDLVLSIEEADQIIGPKGHAYIERTVRGFSDREFSVLPDDRALKKRQHDMRRGMFGEVAFRNCIASTSIPVTEAKHKWYDFAVYDLRVEAKSQKIDSPDIVRLKDLDRKNFYQHLSELSFVFTWAYTHDDRFIKPIALFDAEILDLKLGYVERFDCSGKFGLIDKRHASDLIRAGRLTALNSNIEKIWNDYPSHRSTSAAACVHGDEWVS